MTVSTKSNHKASGTTGKAKKKPASLMTDRVRETPFYAMDSDRGETEVAPFDLSTDLESGDTQVGNAKAGPEGADYYSVENISGANGGKLFVLNKVEKRGAPPKDGDKAGPEDFQPNAV